LIYRPLVVGNGDNIWFFFINLIPSFTLCWLHQFQSGFGK
jgi:hypothetical protein